MKRSAQKSFPQRMWMHLLDSKSLLQGWHRLLHQPNNNNACPCVWQSNHTCGLLEWLAVFDIKNNYLCSNYAQTKTNLSLSLSLSLSCARLTHLTSWWHHVGIMQALRTDSSTDDISRAFSPNRTAFTALSGYICLLILYPGWLLEAYSNYWHLHTRRLTNSLSR